MGERPGGGGRGRIRMAVHHRRRGGHPPPPSRPKGPSSENATLTIGKIWFGHFWSPPPPLILPMAGGPARALLIPPSPAPAHPGPVGTPSLCHRQVSSNTGALTIESGGYLQFMNVDYNARPLNVNGTLSFSSGARIEIVVSDYTAGGVRVRPWATPHQPAHLLGLYGNSAPLPPAPPPRGSEGANRGSANIHNTADQFRTWSGGSGVLQCFGNASCAPQRKGNGLQGNWHRINFPRF